MQNNFDRGHNFEEIHHLANTTTRNCEAFTYNERTIVNPELSNVAMATEGFSQYSLILNIRWSCLIAAHSLLPKRGQYVLAEALQSL